jgi:hypothetical protein
LLLSASANVDSTNKPETTGINSPKRMYVARADKTERMWNLLSPRDLNALPEAHTLAEPEAADLRP